MQELFYRPALDFIKEKRFKGIHDDFLSKFSYACMANSADRINTLDSLTLCIGLLLPINRFVFDNKGMADLFKNELVIDSVTEVKKTNGGYIAKTKSGEVFEGKYAVLATPGNVTKQLLDLPSAQIIGKVILKKNVFVGPLAVIRADERGADGKVSPIVIEEEVNVQDGVIIHSESGTSVTIGAKSSVAHGVTIHGPCTIGNECFLSMRSALYQAILEDHV